MKRYFYNVNTYIDVTDAIEYNRTHDDKKVVNIVPVFEITDKTNMDDFDKDIVSTRFGEYYFETKEAAQNAMNDRVAQHFEEY